jgi:penicillin-binding protein 1C
MSVIDLLHHLLVLQLLQPLSFELGDTTTARSQRHPFLSPGAAYLVAKMLSQGQRPDLPTAWEANPALGRVAFKTGTSFGNRDAWCVAFDPDYTLGLWLGNADARGAVALTGAKAASPVAFSIFSRLNRHRDHWYSAPPEVMQRKVCLLTGEAAGPACPQTRDDDYLPGLSDPQVCRVHQRLTLLKKGGFEVCPKCMTGKDADYLTKVFEVWPLDVTRFLRLRDGKVPALPQHNPACPLFSQRPGPHLLSPEDHGHYELNEILPDQAQRIALSAQAGPDARWLTWFVDGHLVAEGPPEQVHFWRPKPGKHKVSVIDSEGRAAVAEMDVQWKKEKVSKKRVVELGD